MDFPEWTRSASLHSTYLSLCAQHIHKTTTTSAAIWSKWHKYQQWCLDWTWSRCFSLLPRPLHSIPLQQLFQPSHHQTCTGYPKIPRIQHFCQWFFRSCEPMHWQLVTSFSETFALTSLLRSQGFSWLTEMGSQRHPQYTQWCRHMPDPNVPCLSIWCHQEMLSWDKQYWLSSWHSQVTWRFCQHGPNDSRQSWPYSFWQWSPFCTMIQISDHVGRSFLPLSAH